MLGGDVVDRDAAILLSVQQLSVAQPGAVVVRRFVALLHKVLQFELFALGELGHVFGKKLNDSYKC